MTKKQEKQEKQVARGPFGAFVYHQMNMLEEAGKAVVSLLPKDFRTHTSKAIEEGAAGFGALFDGVIDGIETGLEKLRSSPKKDDGEKVKVEVE